MAQDRLARNTDLAPPTTVMTKPPVIHDRLLFEQDRKVAMAADVYALWSQQLTGAVLSGDSLRAWQRFLGMDMSLPAAARQLGMEAYDISDFTNAAALLEIAHDFDPGDLDLRGFLAFAYKETGRYEKALDMLQLAVIEKPDSFYFWWWLGDTQRLLGRYDEALESMLTAAELAPPEEEPNFHEYIDYTRNLASNIPGWDTFEIHREFAQRHERQRRTRRAIAEYINALDLAPPLITGDVQGPLRMGWTYQQIGLQYSYVKEPDIAIDYYLEALHYYDLAQSPENVMRNYQNLALSYMQLAETHADQRMDYLETTLHYWNETLRMAEELDDPSYSRYARGAQLALYARLDSLDSPRLTELRSLLEKEMPWRGPIDDYTVAEVVLGESACRVKEGDWAGARAAVEMVLPYYDSTRYLTDIERTAELNVLLARIYHEQGHPAQSLRYSDDAQRKLDFAREFIDMDAFNRSPNRALLRRIYAARVRATLQRSQPEAALGHLEAYQTRLRRDLLGTKLQDQSISTDPAAESDLIRRRIPRLEERMSAATGAGNDAEAARLNLRLHRDKARLSWLDLGVRFTPPSRISLLPVMALNPEAVQAALPENTALVSYVIDAWGAMIVVTTRASVHGLTVDQASESVVEPLVRAVLQSPGDAGEACQQLYDMLIAPIRSWLPDGLIYIAPDEVLARLPFEMLGPPDSPLIDAFSIAYTASGSHLAHAIDLAASGKKRLSGLSLSDAIMESAKTAFEAVISIEEENRTVKPLLEDVQPGDYLHWSTDADFGQEDAMLCALLADRETKAGRLHAADLLTMPLPAAALVLDINRIDPDIPDSNAIEAFEETLLHAGTPAMIVNLWNTPLEAGDRVLAAFYRNLATMNKADALRAAKREYRQDNADPAAWAGYVLRGDYR